MKEKSFEVDGWKYEYTTTGIQITDPQGHKVGRPVPIEPQRNVGRERKGWDWFING